VAPPSRLMLHTFCFGSVEHALQARRKQIPALKARNNKARGETPGLEGSGTSPARAAQLLHRPYRDYFARIVPRACALGSVALCLGAPDYAGSKKYAALGETPALPANREIRMPTPPVLSAEYAALAGTAAFPRLPPGTNSLQSLVEFYFLFG